MEKVKISVIVPIYKVEKYLVQCIESILNQSFVNLELILVDDGSPDGCGKICDEYAQLDSRIKVIHKENGGLVSARKAGLEVAVGEYATYVDGDDWIAEDMYKHMYNSMAEMKADIVVAGFITETYDGVFNIINKIDTGTYSGNNLEDFKKKVLYYGDKFFEFGVYPAVWNKLFKKDLLLKYQFEVKNTIRMGEDVMCTYPAIMAAKSITITDFCDYHYRKFENTMSTSYDELFFDRMEELCFNFKNVIDKYGYDIERQFGYYVLFLFLTGVQQELSKKNPKLISHKIMTLKKSFDKMKIIYWVKDIDDKNMTFFKKMELRSIKNKTSYGLAFYCLIEKVASKVLKGWYR